MGCFQRIPVLKCGSFPLSTVILSLFFIQFIHFLSDTVTVYKGYKEKIQKVDRLDSLDKIRDKTTVERKKNVLEKDLAVMSNKS